MTPDASATPSSGEKLQMYADNDHLDDKHALKSRLSQVTTYLYPALLALLLIVGTTLLVITVTRRNTCRQLQYDRIEPHLGWLSKDHVEPWMPCIKTARSSRCACPASFVPSTHNPSRCIPSHSRCLQSCHANHHCACLHVQDAGRCLEATRKWMENELKVGAVEPVNHNLLQKNLVQHAWSEHDNRHLEHLLVDTQGGERLFFSADRKTGITIHEQEDDYLLNERWTKFDTNTTEQHIAYTQIDPQAHLCRMSAITSNGTTTHGSIHTCPGASIEAPYFLGAACNHILVLWNGDQHSKVRREEDWVVVRHNFESTIPRLPVLLDAFHRYYSLYDDLLLEVKDLNGDVLGQLFTNVHNPAKFEFVDHHGSMLIANHTHMQLLTSTNVEAWLDM